MAIEWYHILPLLAGLAYAMSAVCSKRALVEGAGMMRLIVATNGFTVLTILLLLFIQEAQVDWSQWGYPVMAGVTFFGAQSCTFLAIRFGDVSIQTPIMGTKIVFVALAVSLFGTALVDTLLWLCAFISAAAVFLLGFSGWGRPKETVISIVLALAASLAFTAADFQMASNTTKFSTAPAPFLFVMVVVNALLSLVFVPFFKGGLTDLPRKSVSWFLAGAGFMALQALIFCGSISSFGQETATEQNIIYSARGFWSILLVSVFSGFFGNLEQHVTPKILVQRLVGTSLLLVAILLVLTR